MDVTLAQGDYALMEMFGATGHGGYMPNGGQQDTPEGIDSYIVWDEYDGWKKFN